MKNKNTKLLLVSIALFTTCTSLVACSASTSTSGEITYCTLNKELKPYNDLKVTASVNDTYDRYVNATFKNNGDQYVSLYSYDYEYVNTSNVTVSSWYADYKCPFTHRYIGPNETINVVADCYPYDNQEKCVASINNKSVRTCYYTSEYTGMKFNDLKMKMFTEEERKEKKLYSYFYVMYKPSGKFIDGDNYHLLVNFTFKGETYTVLSFDPEYEMHGFGFDLESPYYLNYHKWSDPEGRYKDYTIDDSMFTINWVKCYTAWFGKNQKGKCRDVFRCYEDKVARTIKKVAIGVGIFAICVTPFVVIFIVARRKRRKLTTKSQFSFFIYYFYRKNKEKAIIYCAI
ncbi:MAG: hypothetical protein J6N95_05815 [Bacilli bacterium]|nr:hypothetical protein [Bacilli bacterium]